MAKFKFHFVFSRNHKSLKLKNKLLKRYQNYSLNKSSIIVVCGGDGFMLDTIKKKYKLKKPFFGINCGTIGFLMNEISSNHLEKEVLNSKSILVSPLIAQVNTYNKKKTSLLAINEISLLRQTKQTSSIKIKKNNKILQNNLTGDGVILCTPVGSTAYNFSLRGPILKLDSGKLALTPISPFKPRNWKGETISENNQIVFENIKNKRPISIVADNFELRNVTKASVRLEKKIKIKLLFKKKHDYKKKIKNLSILK